jgi:ribosomal protein L11 methyltransferase
MHPPKTYELRLQWLVPHQEIPEFKQRIIDYLLFHGVESFVEGTLDVDINQNQDEPPKDHYHDMGGDFSPMSIYRYSRESLDDIKTRLNSDFGSKIDLTIHTLETAAWMDGWKDSFKPFSTDIFFVRPPWEKVEVPPGQIELVIEPGMAFGTGQHATTKLCLDLLGFVAKNEQSVSNTEGPRTFGVLDVGTGTGILGIAAAKCGFSKVYGTDIEEDAILAAQENAGLNGVSCHWLLGTFPKNSHGNEDVYGVVFANILAVVILRLMDQLIAAVKPGCFLILSGILEGESEEVCRSAQERGLKLIKKSLLDGWCALLLQKES